MRILFCDDNLDILNQLQNYVAEYFEILGGKQPDFAAYTSGDALLYAEQSADIAFLDVEMPGTSGIQVGAILKQKNPYIKIFIVTSYPDYLDEAMRFQVFRYLSKPINKHRLFRNLKDAIYQYNMESHEITISTTEGLFIRRAEEILCVESSGRKVTIHTTDVDYQSTDSLAYWQKALTLPCFYATHRSFIVNMHFVTAIEKDRVQLRNKDKIFYAYLTRRKYTNFKQTYLLYLESVK